jgi:hypothetical protein
VDFLAVKSIEQFIRGDFDFVRHVRISKLDLANDLESTHYAGILDSGLRICDVKMPQAFLSLPRSREDIIGVLCERVTRNGWSEPAQPGGGKDNRQRLILHEEGV